MLFHTLDFAVFFVAVALLYGLLRGRALRAALTAASYFFYGYIQPYYVVLLLALTLSDYAIGLFACSLQGALARGAPELPRELRRPRVLQVRQLRAGDGAHGARAPGPARRAAAGRRAAADRHQLPRVPVLRLRDGRDRRARRSVPQLRPLRALRLLVPAARGGADRAAGTAAPAARHDRGAQGRLRVAAAARRGAVRGGLDPQGGAPTCCPRRRTSSSTLPAAASSAEAAFGIAAFGLQIYGDFSGYSRMAQGISHAFGVELMDNFDRPYAARSFRDFWRRWHISLSSWFRDYVYIPLGGSERGFARQQANVLATMLLSGLWHGAGWTFPIWGAMHGALVVMENATPRFWRRAPVALKVPLVWAGRLPRLGSVPRRRHGRRGRVLPGSRARGLGSPVAGLPVRGRGRCCSPTSSACRWQRPRRRSPRGGAAGARLGRGALWPAAGVVVALLAHVFWGATEKAFIYFRF